MKTVTLACAAIALLIIATVPTPVTAQMSIHGRSSTVIEWLNTPDEETSIPLYEYIGLTLKDVATPGYTVRTYGRLAIDATGETSPDNRIYYAYLEKRRNKDFYSFKLGRQFMTTTAGSSVMDGLRADLYLNKNRLTLFGGGDVHFDDSYDKGDALAGVEFQGNFSIFTYDLSLLRKWDDEYISHDLAGFTIDGELPHDVTLYAETQYSLLTEEVTYGLLGGNWQGSSKWTTRLEYLYSLPVFSATSIYSVFAVSAYQEASADLSYRFSQSLSGVVRYVREIYDEYDDANIYEAGIRIIPINGKSSPSKLANVSGYLIATLRKDDDGQDLKGIKCYGSTLFGESLRGGVGIHLDTLERRIEEDDETTSSRIWIDGSKQITRSMTIVAKIEQVRSALWDSYYQGRLRLTKLF